MTTMARTDHHGVLTVRTRILVWTLLVVAIALGTIILITGKALFTRIDAEATGELGHEADKLRSFAAGEDPSTGSAFADAEALLTGYLSHSLPEENETFFSIIDGRADRRSLGEPLARLDADDAFVASVSDLAAPTWGRVDTTSGPALFSAVPVGLDGDAGSGVLVTVEFLRPDREEAWATVLTMTLAAVVALLLAGLVGWLVAGRALEPVRAVRSAAARIGEGRLDERIEVVGTDDAAQLAITFNAMLDRLQSAFDGQRRFLDDAGHELRTPITVVRGHLELIGDDPEDRAQTLNLVEDELRRMSRLVDDLILLARSERPDFIVVETVALADLVVDTLSKATAIAPRSWQLDAVPEGSAPIDGQRITQALLQLAANAVEYTAEGDVIAMGAEVIDGVLTVWVRDEGRGIDPDEQQRIFERFARGTGSDRRAGSGLGLAIVARIAESHGGAVHVESAPGEGARFTLELPLRRTEVTR